MEMTDFQPWRRSDSRNRITPSIRFTTRKMSKLDSARLKLSKLQMKYGKQENIGKRDFSSSLDISDVDLEVEDVKKVILRDERQESSVKAEGPKHVVISSSNSTSDELEGENESFEKGSLTTDIKITENRFKIELPWFKTKLKTSSVEESVSSISEAMENVRSFSSLEGKSQAEEKEKSELSFELKSKLSQTIGQTKDEEPMNRKTDEENSPHSSVPSVIAEDFINLGSASDVTYDDDFVDELSGSFKNVRLAEDLMFEELDNLKAEQHNIILPKTEELSLDIETEEGNKISDSSLKERLQRSSSQELVQKQKSPSEISRPILLYSSNKKVKQRLIKIIQKNAAVQTERKRTRKTQANLSTSSTNADSSRENLRRYCPILHAVTIPPGLHSDMSSINTGEKSTIKSITSTEDAIRYLTQTQTELTLRLLQRQHALYLSSCQAATRLEKGYTPPTLAATKQFIRRKKRLRDEFRKKHGVTD